MDDTTLVNHNHNKGFLEYAMFHDMDLLNNWFKANQLSLNMSKTVCISCWDGKPGITVTVEGLKIPNVQVTKFLGVYVDHKLAWDKHVSKLLDKLLINKHLLAVSSNMLDNNSLKLIYYAHIQSHLVYGLSIWGSMISGINLTKIFKAQKACAKLACKLPKNASMSSAFQDHGLFLIQEPINVELCKF